MSSRFGPRASGTDGSDFRHRQLIAAHYRDSVTYKARLKAVLFFHFLLVGLVGGHLVDGALRWWGIGALTRITLPVTHAWEWLWASSVSSIALGLAAMPRNRYRLMRWCYYSLFVVGLVPVAVGAGTLLPDLIVYVKEPQQQHTPLLGGFPVVVLWFMWFAVALQLHAFSMYFALQLVRAWTPLKPPASAAPPVDNKKSN